jgi:hypothetical protein
MELVDLWLPILLSAAAVWIVSALVWMVLPFHAKDYVGLPNEAAVMGQLRSDGVRPGSYAFPYATRAECKDPEYVRRWKEGPSGWMVVMGPMRMGRNMALTFLVYLVVSVLVGYLASEAIPATAGFMDVFQITGTAGILAYCFSALPNAIWFGHSTPSMVSNFIDGVLYGLTTGLVFALLW